MNYLFRYSLLLFLLAFLYGCQEKMNDRLTLWRNDKIPYGTYYAHHNLRHVFKDAEIENSNASPEYFDNDDNASAYIVIGQRVIPNDRELRAILNHVYAGNQVFISAFKIGDNLLDSLGLASSNYWELHESDSLITRIYDPATVADSSSFSYPGRKINNYFTLLDSSITNILGTDDKGRANFVRINYESGGSAIIHLNPLTFTNFFLLHKHNKQYYDMAMSYIPDSVTTVRWDDYYRHHIYGKNDSERSAFSKLSHILNNEVLRWAFWLTLLLFGILYLFESKRKQRVVPVIKKLDNASLDFVKTVGRLYYQRRDNKNLAAKMIAHFLGHIRSRYNISTSKLDEEFEKGLAFRSGMQLEDIKTLVGHAKTIEEKQAVTDAELLYFNDKLDKFYKQT